MSLFVLLEVLGLLELLEVLEVLILGSQFLKYVSLTAVCFNSPQIGQKEAG